MDRERIYLVDGALTDEDYNVKVVEMRRLADKMEDDADMNHFVMNHTCGKCRFDDTLAAAVKNTMSKQQIVYSEDKIDFVFKKEATENIILSSKRSFEAAKAYKGKRVAVLDFANATRPGGGPWHSRAQEESLCRCSTLQGCLFLAEPSYYKKHYNMEWPWGTDDLIYVPEVVVFKEDERGPRMLPKEDRFLVDVIVAAAPHFGEHEDINREKLEKVLTRRLERVLQIAQKNGAEVLVLGAFGNGAFHNPPEITAKVFKELLTKYHFETVEFAIFSHDGNKNLETFKEVFGK